MPSKNRVLLSAAGSGKTTAIVEEALRGSDQRIAVVTYTRENLAELERAFRAAGGRPPHVRLYTWYEFLLRELARPYQNTLHPKRIDGLYYVSGKTRDHVKREDVAKYHFTAGNLLISDRAADFVLRCNDASGGLVLKRLTALVTRVYVDEVQDLSGYDLDLLDLFARTGDLGLVLYGDVRQATYATNRNDRNKQYRGSKVAEFFNRWVTEAICEVEHRNWSYRCNQQICDFADRFYPDMPETQSKNTDITAHDGVFCISRNLVARYIEAFQPTVLRHDVRTKCDGLPAVNFGLCKGRTYPRTLIFPNKTLEAYLKTGTGLDSPPKYYVGVTRARYSVTFVYDGPLGVAGVTRFTFPA